MAERSDLMSEVEQLERELAEHRALLERIDGNRLEVDDLEVFAALVSKAIEEAEEEERMAEAMGAEDSKPRVGEE